MKNAILVAMAAEWECRYAVVETSDRVPVDAQGLYIIMDFSIYDAKRAGFGGSCIYHKKENDRL
ncbi:MAG: hypothetical protein ACLTTO_06325 [Lachnospiraceae bacterium]